MRPTRNIKAQLIISGRYVWRHRGLWLRALLCFLIGATFLAADQDHDYDFRLMARGRQPVDKNIVVLNIQRGEWQSIMNSHSTMGPLKESAYFSDSYYWHESTWNKILKKILQHEPRAVGITLYFGQNITKPTAELTQSHPFNDSRLAWGTMLDREGRILPSRFARTYSRKSGIVDFTLDRDGSVRRFGSQTLPIPALAVQLAKHDHDFEKFQLANLFQKSEIINYRGQHNSFHHLSLSELMNDKITPQNLRDKTIIIGSFDPNGSEYVTPVGKLSRAEITANILDNIKNDRWVSRLPAWGSILLIAFAVTLAAVVTTVYSQYLALFILFWGNLFYTTLSFWLFDVYSFWTPILTITIVMAVTYFTFMSFQLTLKEYLNLQLEKEHDFLISVETLKNNFISLISHDLKTPIAKIQAICDRLLNESKDEKTIDDVHRLKIVAAELHRYIQTILQVAKVESREFRLNLDAADINELIEAVVEQLKPLADAKSIQIDLNLEPMFLVEVDTILIREVILNIIENAIKYSPSNANVLVSTTEVDDRLFFTVEDQGPGVPLEEQSQIFEKFYRGESGKAQQKGSGLGLYLVKYFVERHNGRVFFESKPGQGARVGFSLPISDNELALAAQGAETAAPTGQIDIQNNIGEANENPT